MPQIAVDLAQGIMDGAGIVNGVVVPQIPLTSISISTTASSTATAYPNGRKAAIDSLGNMYVVFADASGQIQCYKSTDNGSTWASLNFPAIAGYTQASPAIAIDSSNNLHVVWHGKDSGSPSYNQIKYSRYNGTAWSPWTNIQTISGYDQLRPSIVVDSSNNLHVVWYGRDSNNPSYFQIKYSKYNGASWSSWANIQTISGYYQYSPSIAVGSNNNLHVVWYGCDSSNSTYGQIKYSRYDGSSWSPWANIQVISGYGQYDPCIAIDSSNNLHVVWDGRDSGSPSRYQIKYSKYNGSVWSPWANIQVITGYDQTYPSIAVDSNGNLHVIWYGTDATSSYSQIKYSKYDGVSWSPWTNLSPAPGIAQVHPCLTGKSLLPIIWTEGNASPYSVKALVQGAASGTWRQTFDAGRNARWYGTYTGSGVTLTARSSQDNVHWSEWTPFPVFGRYVEVKADLTPTATLNSLTLDANTDTYNPKITLAQRNRMITLVPSKITVTLASPRHPIRLEE